MPPPAPEVLLPNTSVLFKVRVPSRFPMPPPPTGLFPPVMLRRFSAKAPLGPSTSSSRKSVLLPSRVAFLPWIVIPVVTTGRASLPTPELKAPEVKA